MILLFLVKLWWMFLSEIEMLLCDGVGDCLVGCGMLVFGFLMVWVVGGVFMCVLGELGCFLVVMWDVLCFGLWWVECLYIECFFFGVFIFCLFVG